MAFRQCDEMVYARFALHRYEPQLFKTTDRRLKEPSGAERVPPMALSKNVLGVWSEVQACGWRSKIFSQPLARVGVSGRYSYVNARYARPQLALFLSSIPVLLALLRYSTPCTILLPLLCHKYCIYSPTAHRHNNHRLSAPAVPTLPHSDVPSATCRRHAIVQRIQVLPRVCRFRALHQAPDEKTTRLISLHLLSGINIERTTTDYHHRTSHGASTALHPERQRIRHSHLGRQATARAGRSSSDVRHKREHCALNTGTATTRRHRPNSHSLPRPRLRTCTRRSRRNRPRFSARLHLPHLAALDPVQW
jgi:hypothetical protein